MVNDIKYIIKRIIIGVGIAIILMLLKGGLLLDTNALEYKKCPDETNGFFFYNNQDNVRNDRDLLYGQINGINLYYRSFGNATARDQIGFRFSSFDNPLNNVSIQFIFYNNGLVSPYSIPYQAFIRDTSSNKYYSCFSDSSGTYSSSTSSANYTSPWNAFYCPNVSLSSSFELIITSGFNSPQSNSTMGITCLTVNTDNEQNLLEEQNNHLQDINDNIEDSSVDNSSVSSTIQNGSSQIASNNSITQLLTLPISLYQNILNSVGGSCSSFSLGTLYNHQLTLPCINLQNLLGSTLYGIIDILISGLFILSFRKKMVDIFNNMTSLKDRGNELE